MLKKSFLYSLFCSTCLSAALCPAQAQDAGNPPSSDMRYVPHLARYVSINDVSPAELSRLMSLPPANENVYRTTPPRYQPSLEEIINVRRITYKLTHPEIPYVAPHAPQSSPVDKLVGGAALQSMMDLSKSNDRTIGFICGVFWLTVLGLFASKIILQRYKFRAE